MIPAGAAEAIRLSLQLALLTTAILLVVSTPIAWWLARSRASWREIPAAIVSLPLVLPPTVLGFYLLVLFGARSVIGQAFTAVFGQSLAFSFQGLLVASVIANLPFAVQPIQRGFESVAPDLRDAAACCGLTPWQRFLRVELPLAWTGVLTGAILTFAHTLGEFGVVLMVGGNIPGVTRTLSVAIYDRMQTFDDQGAATMAAVLLGVSIATLLLTTTLTTRLASGAERSRG